MIIYSIPHLHVTVAAAAAHAHVAQINQRVVLRLPREARVPLAVVGLEEDALGVFLHSACTWPTAKSDI